MAGKKWRVTGIVLAGVAALLIGLYLLLDTILLHYVNDTLDRRLPGYRGHIGGLELELFAGGYYLRDVEIDKMDGQEVTPFFEAEEVNFNLLWAALFNGRLAGEVEMVRPRVIFIHGSDETESQAGEGGQWLQAIKDLTPFELERGEVRDGIITLRNTQGEIPQELGITEVNLVAKNLANAPDVPGQTMGTLDGTAMFVQQAPFEFHLALDPMAREPLFDADLRIRNLDVVRLNPLTRAYADFDFEEGGAEVAAELAVKHNQIRGYLKLILTDLVVARYENDVQEDEDGLVLFTWENLVGLFVWLTEQSSIDRFATLVPITGEYEEPDVGAGTAVINAFKNAYGESIRNGLENNTDLRAGFEEGPEAYRDKLQHAVDSPNEPDRSGTYTEDEDTPPAATDTGPPGKS